MAILLSPALVADVGEVALAALTLAMSIRAGLAVQRRAKALHGARV